jgi:PKD repeat protein
MIKYIILICLLIMSIMQYADGTPSEGSGTETDPYLIETLDNLLWLSTTQTVWGSSIYFLQTQDIDASDTQNWNEGAGFSPIGGVESYLQFCGYYDGDGHIIDSLYIYRPGGAATGSTGFFGKTNGATIEALGITNLEVTGRSNVGGLVGRNHDSTIIGCYVSGSVSGLHDVGGLVGESDDSSISDCHASGSVSGSEGVGGLVGLNEDATIAGSYAIGSVDGEIYVGGLVGENHRASITECYASGNVTGDEIVGGLAGSAHYECTVSNSYSSGNVTGSAMVGGLIGNMQRTLVINSFYDYETVYINDQHKISIGALNTELYNEWLDNNMTLEITDYLSYDDGNYLISTAADFARLMAFGQNSDYSFLLTSDIDLTGNPNIFIPYFAGTFNGNSHNIDGLHVDSPLINCIGLFGSTCGATIQALGVTNIVVAGHDYVGGLAGYSWNSSISESYVNGSVTGHWEVGGLTGWNIETPINECYVGGSVNGVYDVGGLSGWNDNSTVSNCYVRSTVNGDLSVGGLVGVNLESTINESYATGYINGNIYTGGLVGYNHLAQISNCIWNIETTGQSFGYGEDAGGSIIYVLGLTISEMQITSNYTDISWDFVDENINGMEDFWAINSDLNNSYPYIVDLEWSYYGSGLVAQFDANPTYGNTPLTVNFMDESVALDPIVTWQWDFENDGVIDSYDQNPIWVYNEPGIYSVSLTVSNDNTRETSTELKENYITVNYDSIQPAGSGTETDPYLVESLSNLLWISTNESCWSSYFLQTADIDASDTETWNFGAGFLPIGDSIFQGNYNGDYHTIDGLYINRPDDNYIGLFGYTSGSVIEALGVTNVNVTGCSKVGGLVAFNYSQSLISDCYVSGNVNGESDVVGGLVGRNTLSMINRCYSDVIVTGSGRVGGLVGENGGHSNIWESYATGSVTAGSEVGGLVGATTGSNINSCYSSVTVMGDGIYIGGLAGNFAETSLSESYYDYETVLINNEHIITEGALNSELYNEWINNDLTLDITDYLSYDDGDYLINTTEDFARLLAFGQNEQYSFRLTDDLDLADNPDFYIPYFSGTFKGDFHTIHGLNVNRTESKNIGLFGYTHQATIEALSVTEVDINGHYLVGALVGMAYSSTVSKCFASGDVNGNDDSIGGLIGWTQNSAVSKCYTNCNVSGNYYIGGLIGTNRASITSECFADGNVSANSQAGGLVGFNNGSSTIDCYASGSVTGDEWSGGLIGCNWDSNISNCYATGEVIGVNQCGALIGVNCSYISYSIWNNETSGQTAGVGLNDNGTVMELLEATTEEMQTISTYTDIGWDFAGESINGDEDIWDMNEAINDGFPFIYDVEFPVTNDEYLIENGKLKIENYPNPFNPVTNICFEIGEDSDVLVNIYNIRGQKIETLADSYYEAGRHSLIWDAERYSSGIYIISIKSSTMSEVKKITLLK